MAVTVVQSGVCSTASAPLVSIATGTAGKLTCDNRNSACSSLLSWNPMRAGDGVSSSSSGRLDVIGIGSSRKHRARIVTVRASRGGSRPGDKESKAAYDAFFLGKSVAEVINERVGSAIGEFLSDIGQRQAEQQKKLREFQDEIKYRATNAAKKAAQKALAEDRAKQVTTPPTSSPVQPPPSTSGLSNPEQQ